MCAAHNRVDITGQRYGRWLVLGYAGTRGKYAYWLCRCDCGTEKAVSGGSLRWGGTFSCGCLARETHTGNTYSKVHGHSSKPEAYQKRSPEYVSWQSMIRRCVDPKAARYERYGARGITVCDRWRDSFETFLADMGPRSAGTTIDRINNDGNYEPGNCRWGTKEQQYASRSKRRSSKTDEEKRAIRNERARQWRARNKAYISQYNRAYRNRTNVV